MRTPFARGSLPEAVLQTSLSDGATRASIHLDHPALTAEQVEQLVADLSALRRRMKPAAGKTHSAPPDTADGPEKAD